MTSILLTAVEEMVLCEMGIIVVAADKNELDTVIVSHSCCL